MKHLEGCASAGEHNQLVGFLVHGKKDETCPVEGAEKMFNALKRLDRTAELALYDGEGHVPGDWSLVNAVDATDRMVKWFEKYMPPKTAAK